LALKIHNTLTRQKEEFVPLSPPEVRIYVCGVTVYALSHIGHGRSAVVFDVIRRHLQFKGYQVRFVKNFTDVDDKIIKRARDEGVSPDEVARRYIQEYRKDMEALGVRPPDVEPKATDHVRQMIALIERLIANGFAYVVDGDVYFEVRRFPAYGRLSGKNLDELLVGARVEPDERKRDPRDFALWKAAKPDEPSWESPWGPGRPGWHIECSAMSMEHLGESFDIHGGGEDLIFPHHECEIAQSEAGTKKMFARYWIHNGFVNLGAEKMSKSLGNVLLIRNLLEHYHPDTLRLHLLGTHYRSPLDFQEMRLSDATRAGGRLRILVSRAFHLAGQAGAKMIEPSETELRESFIHDLLGAIVGDELRDEVLQCHTRFIEAMDDDFNTPQAFGALFDLSHVLNRYHEIGVQGERLQRFLEAVRILLVLGRTLGLLYRHVNPFEFSAMQRADIEPLIAAREEARKCRDWKRADEIRDQINALGVIVEDTPGGPRYKWKGAP